MLLPRPTPTLVSEECNAFDGDPSNRLTEDALGLLLKSFPANSDPAEVLLKVTVLNQLYRTMIFDVETVTRHIIAQGLDPLIADGRLEAVDQIAKVSFDGKTRHNFSFATKYCNWHNPTAYAIYDSNALASLVQYRNQDFFATFDDDDTLKCSTNFQAIVIAFREYYGLGEFSLKQLDKYLWRVGRRLKGNTT